MHFPGIDAFYNKIRAVSVTVEKLFEFLFAYTCKNCRVRNLVSVKMQDRNNCALGCGIQEFVRMPACRKRTCFSFSVSDNAGDNQVRVIESRAESVRYRISELAALQYASSLEVSSLEITGTASPSMISPKIAVIMP